jgi:hypothetical protein
MDAIRETLKSHGVARCVAFVVARTASGHEAVLERWLRDGYELGNHTFDHRRAKWTSVGNFVASITRCHELLERVGAFGEGKTAWFRFPYLSRGRNSAARQAIQMKCEALGYRIAHASVDFYDDRFEKRFAAATRRGDAAGAVAIGQRYEEVACASIQFAAARMRQALGRTAPLVPYCHFGPISRQHLSGILQRLRSADVELCSLEDALMDPVYRGFDADLRQDGLVTNTLPKSQLAKVGSGLVRLSELAGLASQSRLGPRWPYLR